MARWKTAPLEFAPPAFAIVRAVPDTFDQCIRQIAAPIDVARARSQHRAYVSALKESGVVVKELPADPALPDSCFVEDPALVLSRRALLTRSAAPTRRGEAGSLRAVLAGWCQVAAMPAPATLDGGDVLRLGRRLYVGRTARTNADGVSWLRLMATAEGLEVVDVPLRQGLHLKSVCTLASPELLLYLPESLDPGVFEGIEPLPVPEDHGANVLALGDTVLVSADAPQTADLLRSRGIRVRTLQVSEFHKGDGALTCLSIRLPRAGTWVA